jgi:hypothetical protein
MAAKADIKPDVLASKTFMISMAGALLYIAVVFAFVIGGNRTDEKSPDFKYEKAGAPVHAAYDPLVSQGLQHD